MVKYTTEDHIRLSSESQLLIQCVCAVLGYPPLPAWSLSNGHQAWQGLDTDVTPFHNSFNILQMAAPGAAI